MKTISAEDGKFASLDEVGTPSTTEEGWTFEGWYTDKDCTTKFVPTTPIANDTNLYAKWSYKLSEVVDPDDGKDDTGDGDNEGIDPDPTDPGDQPGNKPGDEPGDKPSDKPADDKKPANSKDNTLAATGDAMSLTVATLSFVALCVNLWYRNFQKNYCHVPARS